MKGFNLLRAHLDTFEKLRQEKGLKYKSNREDYAKEIAKICIPCAQGILAGCFKVTNPLGEQSVERIIKPTVIELYYHEEGNGRFKDPVMYHTNDRKFYEFYKDKYEEYKDRKDRKSYFDRRGFKELPYYPIGSLNPHPSGIDITFENPKEHYRASFLIREYLVSFDGGKSIPISNSTDIFDDMLFNGILLDNSEWIEWIDGDVDSVTVYPAPRKNVSAYEKYNDSPELWRKIVKGTDSNNKLIFEKCSFKWQFSAKKQ